MELEPGVRTGDAGEGLIYKGTRAYELAQLLLDLIKAKRLQLSSLLSLCCPV